MLSAEDIPLFHNTRPIMVANDTHRFDLMELAPVGHNGWVLLGEVGRYVRVSSDRFDGVHFTAGGAGGAGGIVVKMSGSDGETTEVTALEPIVAESSSSAGGMQAGEEWVVHVRKVTFGPSGKSTVAFS